VHICAAMCYILERMLVGSIPQSACVAASLWLPIFDIVVGLYYDCRIIAFVNFQ